MYWAASCGGCEIAIVELREKILDLDAAADILFWPVAMDFKYKDVEAMPDGHMDVCLFNGAIRTSENEHMAHLLRKKAKVLVAFGSCATKAASPAWPTSTAASRSLTASTWRRPRRTTRTALCRSTRTRCPRASSRSPHFYNTVKTLGQVEDVDYFVPGCPPQPPQIWAVIEAILGGNLPAKGSVVGANDKTVCDECKHIREERRIKKFYRPHEIIPDSTKCLFDQGHDLRRTGDAGRLRRALHQGGHALPGLLWPAAQCGRPGRGAPVGDRVGRGCRHRRRGGPHRRPRSWTRWAPSTASACLPRCFTAPR